ncbi:MAG: glutathione S-transferase [Deltaproteobacteria bacterium]|nr:glutathione S-transferase [Deltaproteobacteria bacterium]MCW5801860.1 glutathione S-transferase [Deltaproteobacteria bacterium]
MITVHHLNNSRSQRVLWLLEELELPYEIVKYERDPQTMLAPRSLEKIHPLGKSPVISDGGVVIAESAVILEHLVEQHGKGRLVPPAGTPAYRDYRYFMHYAEGSLMPNLLLKLVCNRIKAKAPFLVRPVAKKIANTVSDTFVDPNLKRHLAFLDDHLAKHAWFAGDELTAADIQMSFGCEAIVARGGGLGVSVERIRKLVDTFRARPAYQRALDKGGPYSLES